MPHHAWPVVIGVGELLLEDPFPARVVCATGALAAQATPSIKRRGIFGGPAARSMRGRSGEAISVSIKLGLRIFIWSYPKLELSVPLFLPLFKDSPGCYPIRNTRRRIHRATMQGGLLLIISHRRS